MTTNTTTIRRTAIGAGLLTACLGMFALSASPASAAETSGQHSAAAGAPRSTSAPASPSTVPTHASEKSAQASTASSSPSNNVISGISLNVTNKTDRMMAVTFMYDGPAGGQANWTWLNPGQSASASNATASGPDIWNSYVYFPKDNKQVKFESKLAAWSANTTITVNGAETELDRGQQVTASAGEHSYTASRAQADILLPKWEWMDGNPTVRPDMGLTLSS